MPDFKHFCSPFFGSQSLSVSWDSDRGGYKGRVLGIKCPELHSDDRTDLINKLEAYQESHQKQQAALLEEILSFESLPSLADLHPIALSRGIKTVEDLWEFLEKSQKEWLLNRSL